jgi:hypothetical protein
MKTYFYFLDLNLQNSIFTEILANQSHCENGINISFRFKCLLLKEFIYLSTGLRLQKKR